MRLRSAEARERAELRAAELREKVVTIVRSQLPSGARAWLVGSLAWGGFGERSDVDLVLAGVDGERATAIEIAVSRAAQAEVDLLVFQALPRSYQDRIEREGVPIHGG